MIFSGQHSCSQCVADYHFAMSFSIICQDWLSNIRNDVLAGLVVALALIPEAIAFSIIAGADPKVGLYASFSMAVVIAFAGGRPGTLKSLSIEPEEAIAAYVKDCGSALLVIGAYGRSRIRHLIVGSTTSTLLRLSTVPALVTR